MLNRLAAACCVLSLPLFTFSLAAVSGLPALLTAFDLIWVKRLLRNPVIVFPWLALIKLGFGTAAAPFFRVYGEEFCCSLDWERTEAVIVEGESPLARPPPCTYYSLLLLLLFVDIMT